MKKFTLNHVAWYTKGWYKMSKNMNEIYDDLRKCIEADGYSGDLFSNTDIHRFLLGKCESVLPHRFVGSMIITEISPDNCWKYGYYTKNMSQLLKSVRNESDDDLPNWNLSDAVTMYCLSEISQMDVKYIEHKDIPRADVLPLTSHLTNKEINNFFKKYESNIS